MKLSARKNKSYYEFIGEQLEKLSFKFFKKYKTSENNDIFTKYRSWQATFDNIEDLSFVFSTKNSLNMAYRNLMTKMLEVTNYKRNNDKWTQFVAISFLNEIFRLDLNNPYSEYAYDKEYKIEIAERYNVPINRFRTQTALFLNNLEKGKDKFELDKYFSRFEILEYKYKYKEEKLKEDLEANKVSDSDKYLLALYGMELD